MSDPIDQVSKALRGVGPLQGPALVDALAAVCWLMAAADGVVSDDEAAHITATLGALGPTVDDLRDVNARFAALVQAGGPVDASAVIADIARRIVDPAQRRTALAYAAGVSFADGNYDFEEEVTLVALADAFAIPNDEAARIIDGARGGA